MMLSINGRALLQVLLLLPSYIGSTYIILCTTADHQPYGNLFVVMSLVL